MVHLVRKKWKKKFNNKISTALSLAMKSSLYTLMDMFDHSSIRHHCRGKGTLRHGEMHKAAYRGRWGKAYPNKKLGEELEVSAKKIARSNRGEACVKN